MKRAIRASLILLLSGFSLSPLSAQTGATDLEFLKFNPDAASAAMGRAFLGTGSKMHLYTDPSAFLRKEGTLYAGYATSFMPLQSDLTPNSYHALSMGYKPEDHWGLFGGFRVQSGRVIPLIDETGMEYGTLKPSDWSIDLGAAWSFAERWTAFLSAGYLHSFHGQHTGALIFGGGVNFSDQKIAFGLPLLYSLTASVTNVGTPLENGKAASLPDLPSALNLGGNTTLDIAEGHAITLAGMLALRLGSHPMERVYGGVGLDYEVMHLVDLRGGWSWQNGHSSWTMGLGAKYRMVSLDFAYILSGKDKTFNQLRLGLGLCF